VALGAIPLLAINAESPIYAYRFYDDFELIARQFRYCITFSGLFDSCKNESLIAMHFPSYHMRDDQSDIVPWQNRSFMAIVAGNKSGRIEWRSKIDKLLKRVFGTKSSSTDFAHAATSKVKSSKRWSYIIQQLRYEIGKIFSKSFRDAMKNELHSLRIEAIRFFGARGILHLYGGGWDEYERYSSKYRYEMQTIIPKVYRGKCSDKIKTISGYKFVFCAENTAYPGYVTEKIIDCFVAGVIPVYIGAPDIKNFIPEGLFIDFREFESFEALEHRLMTLEEAEAYEMIASARRFLYEGEGRKFSYESMAEIVYDIVRSLDDKTK
jgi:hypothetical protein